MRSFTAIGFLVAALALAGCGASPSTALPDVTGQRLDTAQDTLDAAGLRYDTVGGGTLGIVVRSHWIVCRQKPAAGTRARSVTLFVAHSCPSAAPGGVPDVIDDRLDEAREQLEAAGFRVVVRSDDDDSIVVERFWTVCDQSPAPGHRGRTVVLDVAHDCWENS